MGLRKRKGAPGGCPDAPSSNQGLGQFLRLARRVRRLFIAFEGELVHRFPLLWFGQNGPHPVKYFTVHTAFRRRQSGRVSPEISQMVAGRRADQGGVRHTVREEGMLTLRQMKRIFVVRRKNLTQRYTAPIARYFCAWILGASRFGGRAANTIPERGISSPICVGFLTSRHQRVVRSSLMSVVKQPTQRALI